MTCECSCESALAQILLLVDRRGDGVSLDGRDPDTVVRAVEKQLRLKKQTVVKPKREQTARKAVRPVSKRRAKKQVERRNAVIAAPSERRAEIGGEDPSFRKWIVQLACAVDLERVTTGVDPCHLRTKRIAGDWVAGAGGEPVGNIFPARRKHHTEQHDIGIKSFATKQGLDLEQVCRPVGEGYLLGLDPEEMSERARAAGGYQHVRFED